MDNKVNRLPKRDEIDAAYKWKLEDIYATDDDWEADFKKVKQMVGEIVKYKGRLGESAENLLGCLRLCDEMLSVNDCVFVYARMRRDEDNTVAKYQALTDRARSLYTEVTAAISFINPEIISIPEEKLNKFIDENEGLKLYRHFFDELLRQKEHTLTEREEELLALVSDVTRASGEIFSMLNDADIKFPVIKDEEGRDVELTKGRYIKFLESRDRRVRRDAFHALYSSYKSLRNTLAATLASNVKKNRFYSIVRKYNSPLEYYLDDDNISTKVYDNLIETVNRNLPLLHRYLRLRKKALGLDELHMYDLYVPIVDEIKKDISYNEAKEMVINGLKPLGSEYLGYLRQGFESGWIDVYENQNKTSGAYSWGAYTTHPYVLLNFQGTINDVFTIAHEMGHAMHTFYTNMTQPYIYSHYRIFVAEVASTVNESLLMKYMLDNTTDKKEKAWLLNHYLEEFRGTVFRQVMFAEFEKLIHERAMEGIALTEHELSSIYKGLNDKYYGAEVNVDQDIEMEWARIPHFYSSFYVYKYATGFSAALSLSNQVLSEGAPAVERYINFLKSGGSNYPLELLKKAGVDLSTPKPIQDAMDTFEQVLTELEKLVETLA